MRNPARYITERLGFEERLRASEGRRAADDVRLGTGMASFIGWVSTGLVSIYTASEAWTLSSDTVHTVTGDVMRSGIDVTSIGRGVIAAASIAAVAAESTRFFFITTEMLSELPPDEAYVEDY